MAGFVYTEALGFVYADDHEKIAQVEALQTQQELYRQAGQEADERRRRALLSRVIGECRHCGGDLTPHPTGINGRSVSIGSCRDCGGRSPVRATL